MAHGYFYILYGGLPADNYDITGRLLCIALRVFGRGCPKIFIWLYTSWLKDVYELSVDNSLKCQGKKFPFS